MIANHFLAETRSVGLPEYNIVLAAGNIHLWSNLGIRNTKEVYETITDVMFCGISYGLFMAIFGTPPRLGWRGRPLSM
jgi:hypothetical protein